MIKLFGRLKQRGPLLFIGSTLFAVSAMVGIPTPASAWSEWGNLVSQDSGLCLTAAAATDFSVWQASCSNWQGNAYWRMKPIGNGYYSIVNPWGKCLDVYAFNHDNPGRVTTWDCNGYTNQQWAVTTSIYGLNLKPRHAINDNGGRGKCLDVIGFSHTSGDPVGQWDCWGGQNQLWRFTGWQ